MVEEVLVCLLFPMLIGQLGIIIILGIIQSLLIDIKRMLHK